MKNYKNMNHIPFDEVCINRNEIVPIISDGNEILREIINCCVERYLIDKSIETYECCQGEASDTDFDFDDTYYSTYIMFNIPEGSEQYIHSILKSIESFGRAKYTLAQNCRDKTILLDVRQSYRDRKNANMFLEAIKEAVMDYKNYNASDINILNIINLLKNTYNSTYDLVINKDMRNTNYSVMYLDSHGGSPLNTSPINSISLTKEQLANFDTETFMNRGISRTKRLY